MEHIGAIAEFFPNSEGVFPGIEDDKDLLFLTDFRG